MTYLEDVDMLSVGTTDGVSVYSSTHGKLHGSSFLNGGVHLITVAPEGTA